MRVNPNKQIYLGFGISFFLTLSVPVFFPSFKILFFVPFLVMSFYKAPFRKCLQWSIASGLILDLLSSTHILGLWVLNFLITTAILYPQKKHFFQEKLFTIPSLTFLYSSLSTSIHVCFLYIFDRGFLLSFSWLLSDLVIYPALDALIGFCLFTLVPIFRPWQKKREYFLKR